MMGKLGPLVKVRYRINTCTQKKGDLKMLPKTVANHMSRRGIVKIIKVTEGYD